MYCFKERYMMAHGCKVMVRGRVWEEDVPPPVQNAAKITSK